MTDFKLLSVSMTLNRALDCSKVLTVPFRSGDYETEERIKKAASDLGYSAKTISGSKRISSVLVEAAGQKEMKL